MAIVRANGRVSREDVDSSPEIISADESDDDDDLSNSSDSGTESDPSDADSGMGSDEFDLSELGESNTEFCQVDNQSFSVPLDLYDLPDLMSVLSLETWNDCLTEEERFRLSEFLPDMDQETLGRTLKELFTGKNFHFGSPIHDMFNKFKGGMLDPRVVLYRRGLGFFRKREHYHCLRKYQNSIVGGIVKIRNTWKNCTGHGIAERLRVLNIVRSQRGLDYEREGDGGSETDLENSDDRALDTVRFGKDNAKGILKVTPPKISAKKEYTGISGYSLPSKGSKGLLGFHQHEQVERFDSRRDVKGDGTRASLLKQGKKKELAKQHARQIERDFGVEEETRGYVAPPLHNSKSRVADQGVTIAAYNPHSLETMSNAKYPAKDWMYKDRLQHQVQKRGQPYRHGKMHEVEEWSVKGQKWKVEDGFKGGKSRIGDSYAMEVQGKFKGKSAYNGNIGMEYSRGGTMFDQSDETESDSSGQMEDDDDEEDISPYVKEFGYPTGAIKGRTIFDSKKSSNVTKVNTSKGKLKSKTADPYVDDIVLVKKTKVPHQGGKSQPLLSRSYTADKNRKGAVDLDHSSQPNYMLDYGSGIMDKNAEYLAPTTEANHYGTSNMPLLGCNMTKKRKGNADIMNQDETEELVYAQYSPMQQIDEPNFIKKKGKKKIEAVTNPLSVVTSDTIIPEKETADVVEGPKPQKKPFTLITPSKHTGFSFAVIHLLSAIRKAMITPHVEDTADIGKLKPKSEENMDVNAVESAQENNLPSLTVEEIVNRVRTNPGDPCILETQEPLQDLVRGVLKIFSSRTAPLGAKAWKALVSYEKSNKSWSWVGPVSFISSDIDIAEEETSPEAWGLPHKTLVKLVDAFANWLKSGQETLKQIGSLPPPPIALLPQLDEKERFRELRAQKSLNTINPSSEEVREYFRKEEMLRYSIPDRAFSYTAADGKKSIVAPLRRGGGKPTSKARDHFMLKPDRPPHVTILCLVRDAAARLPGSIGTRADVCTLIRDSQYIVEDVSDEKVNQVVSGALDRLHYERDPCVQFDTDRKLWVYRHRDREEEDFEDDGTSSTKKWKRQRKDPADQPETGTANDGGDSGRYDLNPDLNADLSSIQARMEDAHGYDDLRSNIENMQTYVDPLSGDRDQGNAMSWEPLGLNPLHENKMLCQENSTNEEFDGEAFNRRMPVGLLSASLL